MDADVGVFKVAEVPTYGKRLYPPSVNYFFLAINQEKHNNKQKTGAI